MEENIQEWTALTIGTSRRAAEDQKRWRELEGSHQWRSNDCLVTGVCVCVNEKDRMADKRGRLKKTNIKMEVIMLFAIS